MKNIESGYGPGKSNVSQTSPQLVASGVIRLLVSAGFQFDKLLDMVKSRGIGDLELQIRTAFLGMMAGQSRQVVDQTVLATRMVVRYFQINGARSLEDLQLKSKQEEEKSDLFRNFEERENFLEEFEPLKEYLMSKFHHNPSMKIAYERSIQCLVDSGISEAGLVGRCSKSENRRGVMEWLCEVLGGLRAGWGGGVSVSRLARSIVEYGAIQARVRCVDSEDTSMIYRGSQVSDDSNMGMVEHLLSSNKDRIAAYRSLEAMKQYFNQMMMKEAMHNGSNMGKVKEMADCCHKVLSLLGISHYNLKGEFDFGETSFRSGLREKLREVEHFLTCGVGGDTLVELCVRYFRNMF